MADIYKVAVGISLSSNASEALGELSRLLTKADDQVGGLIKKWNTLGDGMKSTLAGLVKIGAGTAIADSLWKATEAGGELVKTMGQLQNLGKSMADINQDMAAAVAAQISVHGTNVAGNLKVLRELTGVTATSEDARAILPDVMKAGIVTANLIGGNPEDYVQTLVKTAELRGDGVDPKTGKIDPLRLIAGVKSEVATLVAGGGLIKPGDMLGMVQQAGPMARMDTDPNSFWRGVITAMMDMGGRRAGTAETALGRQLLGDKMTLATAEEMNSLKLFKPGTFHQDGKGFSIDDGGLLGQDILRSSGGMQAWMEGILIPAMKAQGLDQAAQMQELYKVFGTETARRMAALFLTSQAQITKDAGLQEAASKQNLYGNVMGTDLTTNIHGLSEAWSGLMQVIGAPMVKPAIAGLTSITSSINQFVGVLAAHPDLTKMGGEAAGLGSLALVGVGTKNLLAGLFGKGGLGGSAAALNTSAAMLQEAAVALGAKGSGGPGSGPGGGGKGISWGKLALTLGNFAYAAWDMPSDMQGIKKQWAAADQTNKDLGNWWKSHAPDWLQSVLPVNPNGTIGGSVHLPPMSSDAPAVSGIESFRERMRKALGRDPHDFQKPLDLSKAKLPPVQQQIDIKPAPVILDGRVVGQVVQKAIVKAGTTVSGPSSFDAAALAPVSGGGW